MFAIMSVRMFNSSKLREKLVVSLPSSRVLDHAQGLTGSASTQLLAFANERMAAGKPGQLKCEPNSNEVPAE